MLTHKNIQMSIKQEYQSFFFFLLMYLDSKAKIRYSYHNALQPLRSMLELNIIIFPSALTQKKYKKVRTVFIKKNEKT